jgi:hypothetical protein
MVHFSMRLYMYRLYTSQLYKHSVGHRTQDTGHRTQDTGHRTQDTGHRTQDTGHRTQDTVHCEYLYIFHFIFYINISIDTKTIKLLI